MAGGGEGRGPAAARGLRRPPLPRTSAQAAEPFPITGATPALHLEEDRADIRRARDGGHAYPLGETGRPGPLVGDDARRAEGLRAVIDWLEVEQSPGYRPKPAATYRNVYAYDVCHLAGVYLPRVWWTGPALAALAHGDAVVPRYAATPRELNANALCDWLEDHGPDFGWRRSLPLDEVQAAASAGRLAVICAQPADLARSGHISVAAPEQNGHWASRHGAAVERPLQSQAGATTSPMAPAAATGA